MSQHRERFSSSGRFGDRHRKKEEAELLVFGYGCKIFHDDDRVQEQTDQLIAWMGDAEIMCDRYDCRLHLQNLTEWEATPSSSSVHLTEEEAEIEALCDQERYADLEKDQLEEQVYKEEEAKRMQAEMGDRGAMIHFKYEENNSQKKEEQPEVKQEEPSISESAEDQDAFEPRRELKLPPGVEHPRSRKVNFIIEKTASFVAANGVQMEIVIKTKQSRNPQFKFLDWDSPLNRYYKHVLKMIKEKKYVPVIEEMKKEEKPEDSDSDSDGEYLHPSLLGGGNKGSNTPTLECRSPCVSSPKPPEIKYKLGQENDVYSQLYNSLSKMIAKEETKKEDELYEQQCQQAQTAWDNYNYQQMAHAAFIPPANWQQIIDRMAEYVARNGPEFELMVRQRGDPMFSFIDQSSPFFPYYQHKISQYCYEDLCKKKAATQKTNDVNETLKTTATELPKPPAPPASQNKKEPKNSKSTAKELKPLRKVAPISFSLKPKEVSGTNTPLSAVFTRARLEEEDSEFVYPDLSEPESEDDSVDNGQSETNKHDEVEKLPDANVDTAVIYTADDLKLQEESRQLQLLMNQAKERLLEIQRMKETEQHGGIEKEISAVETSLELQISMDTVYNRSSSTPKGLELDPIVLCETTVNDEVVESNSVSIMPKAAHGPSEESVEAQTSFDVVTLVEKIPGVSNSLGGDSQSLKNQRKLKARLFLQNLQDFSSSDGVKQAEIASQTSQRSSTAKNSSTKVGESNSTSRSQSVSSVSSKEEKRKRKKSEVKKEKKRHRSTSSSDNSDRDSRRKNTTKKRRRSRDLPSSYARSHKHSRKEVGDRRSRRSRSDSRERRYRYRHRRSV